MTGPSGFDKAHVETIIADLRRTYEQLRDTPQSASKPTTWSMRLTIEEVGALLEIHDEVVELRRQTVGDWEPDFPPVRVSAIDVVAARLEVDGVSAERIDPLKAMDPRIPEAASRSMDAKIAETIRAVNADARRLTGKVEIRTCPHAGTHHSCPLGGCPTFEDREVTIPDLPDDTFYPEADRLLGREERETPPELPLEPCLDTSSHLSHHWWARRAGSYDRPTQVICPGFDASDETPIA